MNYERRAKDIVDRWQFEDIGISDKPRLIRDIATALQEEKDTILNTMHHEAILIRRMGGDTSAISILLSKLQQRGRDAV